MCSGGNTTAIALLPAKPTKLKYLGKNLLFSINLYHSVTKGLICSKSGKRFTDPSKSSMTGGEDGVIKVV